MNSVGHSGIYKDKIKEQIHQYAEMVRSGDKRVSTALQDLTFPFICPSWTAMNVCGEQDDPQSYNR